MHANIFPVAFLAVITLSGAGCARHSATSSRHPATTGTRNRVVYTGSHIPQPRNQITASELSATTPVGSFSRDPDSLVPTEPIVGATNNAGPGSDTGPNASQKKPGSQ